MSFAQGLRDFLYSAKKLIGDSTCRRWFIGQIFFALLVGSLLLVGIYFACFYFMDSLIDFLAGLLSESGWKWTADISAWILKGSDLASFVLSLILLIFTAGPLMLIGSTLFLGLFGRWQRLKQIAVPERAAEDPPFSMKELLKEIILTLYLLALVVFAFFLGILGPLAIAAFLLSSYAVGREWVQTGDSQFLPEGQLPTSPLYSLGLGLIPTAIAFVPLLGVLTIPVLQFASLQRYRQDRSRA